MDNNRLYIGKNYIETLLLTLTSFEMNNQTLGVKKYVTERLEEEIIALSLAVPSIMHMYKKAVLENYNKMFKDVPKPSIVSNNVFSTILNHLEKHRYEAIENSKVMSENELKRKILELAIMIVRPAILSVLYQAGLVRLSLK